MDLEFLYFFLSHSRHASGSYSTKIKPNWNIGSQLYLLLYKFLYHNLTHVSLLIALKT